VLVREAAPGDILVATGWDVMASNKLSSQTLGYLIPHGGHHKRAAEAGYTINLLYVGPTKVTVGETNSLGNLQGSWPKVVERRVKKMHSFLTDRGDLVALSGYDFRYFSPCKAS